MRKLFSSACCALLVVAGWSSTVQAQVSFQPSDEHELLKKDVGVWNAKGKMWMPGVPEPIEFEGVETNEMVGDFWVTTEFRGNFGGMDFRGNGHTGFNPVTEKFEGIWIDSTSPHRMTISGTFDKSSNTLTVHTVGIGPDGNKMKGKQTIEYKENGSRVMTMYNATPDGGEMVKGMEIIYTKKN